MTAATPVPSWPADLAGELAAWSQDVLKVPAGPSARRGPDGTAGLRRGVDPGRAGAPGTWAVVTVYLLARLVGPLRMAGYRARGLFREPGESRGVDIANGGHRGVRLLVTRALCCRRRAGLLEKPGILPAWDECLELDSAELARLFEQCSP